MSKQYEMRLTGSGGQGVILASIILAQAALLTGRQATQSQSYGPEARGGMCKAETIISEGAIGFPKVTEPDFLLALTQQSLNTYSKGLPEGCVIMADSSLEIPAHVTAENLITVPILDTADNVVGRSITANIVAVGAINAALGLVPEDMLETAVLGEVPKGMAELNLKALKAGAALIAPENKRNIQL